MDPVIYFIADHFPWWGIPLGLIFLEVANIHRRRRYRKQMFMALAVSGVFFTLAVAYFFYNGFENLRPAMKNIERNMSNK